jgi:hypothetical protein
LAETHRDDFDHDIPKIRSLAKEIRPGDFEIAKIEWSIRKSVENPIFLSKKWEGCNRRNCIGTDRIAAKVSNKSFCYQKNIGKVIFRSKKFDQELS